MSAAIGPGDWVEAITDHPRGLFTAKSLYQVTEVHGPLNRGKTCKCHGKDEGGLRFASDGKRRRNSWWCRLNFRPIYRPNSSILTGLLENKYSKEKESV